MSWPLSQDYNEAIQSAAANFADPDLRRGAATVNNLGLPMPFSGNFADVYQVECPDGGRWAVKCFTREVPGLRERYQEISKYLGQVKLPFTVDFTYLEQGIRVGGRWYPVLKMQWVEGLTLNQFVGQFLDKPAMLEALLRLWARMGKYLRAAGAAHCDLQHGNILLVPAANTNSLALKLIDYDGMYVPALAGSKSGELGHPAYQHPQRLREGTYNREVDRFPLLLIATALGALSVKGRALWEKYDNTDNLLFREEDLRAPARSELFRELSQFEDPTTAALTAAVRVALKSKLEAAPLLEEVLAEARQLPTAVRAATPSVAMVSAQPPSAEGIWDFSESIVSVTASAIAPRRTKRKPTKAKRSRVPAAVWIGGAVASLALLVGAVAVGAVLIVKLGKSPANGTEKVIADNNPILVEGNAEQKAKPEEKADPELNAKEKVGEVRRFELNEKVEHGLGRVAAITPDGTQIVRAFQTTLGVWQVADARLVLRTDKGREFPHCISVDPTGRYAAVGNFRGPIDIWDLKDLKKKTTLSGAKLQGEGTTVTAVAFSPDGKRLLSAGMDGCVREWDWDKGEAVERWDQSDTVGVAQSLAFSPDGLHYVIGNTRAVARVMRVDGSKEISRFIGHSDIVTCVVVAPDNRRAVSGSNDSTVRVWDLHTAAELVAFKKHLGPIYSVAVSPNGRWGLSGAADKVVRLWELDSGREIHCFEGHAAGVTAVGFLRDGRHAFSTGQDNVVRVWRLPPTDHSGSAPSVDTASNDKAPTRPEPKPAVKKTEHRLAVPDATALAAAEKEAREVYKEEYAKHEPADVQRLFGRLFVDAVNVTDKPAATRFFLLREARDLAAKSGDVRFSMSVAENMAKIFAVDVWEMKADALEAVGDKATYVAVPRNAGDVAAKVFHEKVVSFALSEADAAAEEDAFAAAQRLVKVAQTSSTPSGIPFIIAQTPGRAKEFAALRKAYEPIPDALSTLASRPDDPEANLVVGKFYALAKGDWDRGLSPLALGSNSKLKDLAKSDLACGTDTEAMAGLANRFAVQAETEDGAAKTHLLWRACYWYERAESGSKGPSRARVARKRAAIENTLPPTWAQVLHAWYGADGTWARPTERFRRVMVLLTVPKLTFSNGVAPALEIPDPFPGQHKTLIVVYRYRGCVHVSATGDADAVNIPAPPGSGGPALGRPESGQELAILDARYGADGTFADVTAKVQSVVKGATLHTKPADLDLGDPFFGRRKALIIVYRYHGRVYLSATGQDQAVSIDAAADR